MDYKDESLNLSNGNRYEISVHQAVFTQEFYDLYQMWYKKTFNKDISEDDVAKCLCNSPLYDSKNLAE